MDSNKCTNLGFASTAELVKGMYEGEPRCLGDIHVVRNIKTDEVLVETGNCYSGPLGLTKNERRTKRVVKMLKRISVVQVVE